MFFKRSSMTPPSDEPNTEQTPENETPIATQPSASEQAEVQKRSKADEAARKQLETELAAKHYFHKKLLETLDLGLLAELEPDVAKRDLHDATLELMRDETHP